MSAESALERVQRLNQDWAANPTVKPVTASPVRKRVVRRKPRTEVPREPAVISALKTFRQNGFPGTSIMDTIHEDEIPF